MTSEPYTPGSLFYLVTEHTQTRSEQYTQVSDLDHAEMLQRILHTVIIN